MTKLRALVTGGAGFIGSHLVDRLLRGRYAVTVIDNFSTGRRENLAHLETHPDLTIIEKNVADFEAIRHEFDGMDWVFHLAAIADIVPSIQRPLDYHRANVDGTAVVLEASRLAGVRRFLYAASSSCYGIPEAYPTPEDSPIAPRYPYALTKYLGEECVRHWARVYKLPAVSLRLFNVYGPRSRTSGAYGAVFGVFLAQKLAGQPFTVVGDGTQERDFTFVTDVADAFVTAAASDVVDEVFNVGSGRSHSVNRLVELLHGPAVHIPKRPGEPDRTLADVSRIRHALGWEVRVSLEQGVAILLANIDYWREARVWTPDTIATATQEWFQYLS